VAAQAVANGRGRDSQQRADLGDGEMLVNVQLSEDLREVGWVGSAAIWPLPARAAWP